MTPKLVDAAADMFAGWPLELGRIEERHGLTFVYPLDPRGFRLEDYCKIPGKNRIELWDGIAVVYPDLDRRSSLLLRYFYELLQEEYNPGFVPFIGPMDVVVGPGTVFAPDLLLLPKASGNPALAADIRPNSRPHVWRARLRGYARAGVQAHWAIDPKALTLTVRELVCQGNKTFWRLMTDDPAGTDYVLPVRTPSIVPGDPIEVMDDPEMLRLVLKGLRRL